MTLQAEQLIYGRIEAEHKSAGPGGLQILWYSEQLSKALVKEIEGIIRCFDVEKQRRLQFARLSDGRFLLSQTRLSCDDVVVDRQRRPSFVCRALVLTGEALGQLEDHPLRLAAANPFTDEIPDLLERHGAPPCLIPSLPLSHNVSEPAEGSSEVPGGELAYALLTAGLEAAELRRAERLVYLRGDHQEACQALSWLFDRLPRRFRRDCSFTTQTDGCRPRPDLFSLTAGTTSPGFRLDQEFLLRDSRVKGRSTTKLRGAAGIFLDAMTALGFELPPGNLGELDLLCSLLADGWSARPPKLDGKVLKRIFETQTKRLEPRLEEAFTSLLGRRLAFGLRAHLLAGLDPELASLIVGILSIDRQDKLEGPLLDALQSWFAEGDPTIGWWTRRRLCKMASRHDRKVLLHWLSSHSSSGWKIASAESMSEDELHTACLRLGRMPLADLVCRRHLNTLLAKSRALEMADRELITLLERVDRIHSTADLAPLEERLSVLDRRSLKRLEKKKWRNPLLHQLIADAARKHLEMERDT